MKITNIRIRKVEGHEKIRACASVVFDDVFAVHDIKVIDGYKGIFVGMPSRLAMVSGEDRHLDIAHPISSPFRDYLTEKVLEAYWKEIERED
jgi:stage V sporulation protein G